MRKEGKFTIDGMPLMYQAKVFQDPSELGINGGRISKLEVTIDLGDGKWHRAFTMLIYDRGWTLEPDDDISKKALDYILKLYD